MIIPVFIGAVFLGRAFDYKNGYASTPFNIFEPDDVKANTIIIPKMFIQSQYRVLDSSSDVTNVLDLDGDISLKLMNEKFEVSGSGEYLKKVINRDKTVELLITVNYETQTETFPSYTKMKTDWRTKDQSQVGTHYIRSITYGGQLIISYRLTAIKSEYMEDIIGAVKANLALSGSLSGDIKGNMEKLAKAVDQKATVTIRQTSTTGSPEALMDIEQIFKAVDEFPENVRKGTEGKGAALRMEIVDLATLEKDYTAFLKNYALDGMLNEAINKYEDVRSANEQYKAWERQGGIWPPEKNKLIDEYQQSLKNTEEEFYIAISALDPTKGVDQFDKAFKAYGEGEDNIPNRYSRELDRLIHIVEEKPFIWYPYTTAVTHYIHWGGQNCSLPSTEPVYVGFAATSPKGIGNGGNMLCLPNHEPSLEENKLSADTVVSYVNGIGYEYPDTTTGQVFCAYCRLENATAVFTIPGRTDCPSETKLEYSGYLMTSSDAGTASRFVCLDGTPDKSSNSDDDKSGKVKPVWTKCKDCDEDEENKYVSCVVCSR